MVQAPGDRYAPRGDRRRGHPRRRRNGRRDVVAVRRPGRARRGRPAILQEHPQSRRQGAAQRSVPRLGQHRSQGRPLQAAAGAGSGHAAACREGDRCGHRRARREVRDGGRLCQPGLHQADHRQLGQRCAIGLRRGLHLRSQLAQPQIHLPHGLCRPRAQGGLSDRQPLRRGRCAGDLRQRPDPLGERPVLPAHQGRLVHPLDPASLFGVRLHPARA